MSESGLFSTRLEGQIAWIKSPEVSQLSFLKCKKNPFIMHILDKNMITAMFCIAGYFSPVFQGMQVAPSKARTDDRLSDPYVPLCFTGATTIT